MEFLERVLKAKFVSHRNVKIPSSNVCLPGAYSDVSVQGISGVAEKLASSRREPVF